MTTNDKTVKGVAVKGKVVKGAAVKGTVVARFEEAAPVVENVWKDK